LEVDQQQPNRYTNQYHDQGIFDQVEDQLSSTLMDDIIKAERTELILILMDNR
jgi:hypothetical protein